MSDHASAGRAPPADHPVSPDPFAARLWAALTPASVAKSLAAAAARGLETRRIFLLVPFAIMAGLIAYCGLPLDPNPTALLIGAAIFLVLIFAARNSLAQIRLAALAMAAWAGFCLLPIHGLLFGTEMLNRQVFGAYEANVDDILTDDLDGERRIIVSGLTPIDQARPVPVRRARLLIRNQDAALAVGDRISMSIRLGPVPAPVVRGGYDSQFHAYFQGIGAFGNVTSNLKNVSEGAPGALRALDGFRRTIGARIAQSLPQPSSGIARALIIGDQSAIAPETRNDMAVAGLAHVLSISGLHLSLVAGGVYAALRLALALSVRAGAHWPIKKLAAFAGILVAILYMLISGGSVPAIRSTIMLGLVFGAVLAGRQALTMRNVAIAAIAILVIDPASLFAPGFQLSFAAVAGLIGFYEIVHSARTAEQGPFGRFLGFFSGIALTSLVAGAATALFAAYHFQQTSPLGIIGNLGALPLVGFVIMPFGFMATIAMPLGLEAPFLAIMGWGIDRMLSYAGLVAAWSANFDAHPLLGPMALITALLAFAWFTYFKSWWRFAGPVLAVPMIAFFGFEPSPDILIADQTNAIAVRGENGLFLLGGRAGTFAVRVWSDTYGEQIAERGAEAPCDPSGCFATIPGRYAVALITKPGAFAEDCRLADLVITRIEPPPGCALHTRVIGPNELAVGGTQWLHWQAEAKAFDIRPAIENPGRPWRIKIP